MKYIIAILCLFFLCFPCHAEELTWETSGSSDGDCVITWSTANGKKQFAVTLQSTILNEMCLELIEETSTSVTLTWDANTEEHLLGYKIYQGLKSRDYSKHYDVGNVTEYQITGLEKGIVYYFAATAYAEGEESDYSNEVNWKHGDPPSEIIIDNRDTNNTSFTGSWSTSGATGFYGTDSVYNKYNETFTFSAKSLNPGIHKVWLWSTYWASRCQEVPIQIKHKDGVTDIQVDQRIEAREWVLLGEFPAENQLGIIITAQEGCSTCADAIKIVEKEKISKKTLIPYSELSITRVNSEETVEVDRSAVYSIDGNTNTFWHTRWKGTDIPKHPHEIVIDTGKNRSLCGMTCVPRQTGDNGTTKEYEISISQTDGDWISVKTGTIENKGSNIIAPWSAVTGRFIRFRALEAFDGDPWCAVSEFEIMEEIEQ